MINKRNAPPHGILSLECVKESFGTQIIRWITRVAFFKIDTYNPVKNAWGRIRTDERLRDGTLNPAPLTWLGYPRPANGIDLYYTRGFIKLSLSMQGHTRVLDILARSKYEHIVRFGCRFFMFSMHDYPFIFDRCHIQRPPALLKKWSSWSPSYRAILSRINANF